MLLLLIAYLIVLPTLAAAQEAVPLGEVIEAESLVAVGAQPEDTYAEDASGGAYVYLAEKQMENARPNAYLEVPIADMRGMYVIRARALATGGGSDSLRWGAGAPWRSIGVPEGGWQWLELEVYGWRPGITTVLVGAREPARIDAIEVVKMDSGECSPHQNAPLRPEPNGCRPVDVNPPTFRWADQGGATCRVQVARDAQFGDAVLEETASETFLRPLQPLPEGQLHWRWRCEDWEAGEWAAAESFTIDEGTARWPLPAWEESFARVPDAHPRVYMRPDDLAAMREWAQGEGAAVVERVRSRMQSQLGARLPLEETKQRGEGLSREEAVIQRITFKAEASRTAGAIGNLALMYALTGDEECAAEARRRALLVAELDPRGYASHAVSDFGNGTIVEGMALAYDLMQDYLSAEELATIREALHERLAITAPIFRNLEQRVHNAHAWQHTLLQFMAGALALYGEMPQADGWFEWGVKATVALYPWFGGADGGSAEMASYFAGTNLHSSMAMRDLIFHATAIDLCGNPWYASNVYYTIYAHPPNHHRSQFGDHPGGAMSPGPHSRAYLTTRYRAALLNDPFAAAYAAHYEGDLAGVASLREAFGWLRLEAPAPASLSGLPDARAFRDIGVVYLHTAIDRPEDNVFFEFKSGPYGSHGHSHADQNAFNLSAFNEPLLVDTGYYHSYGDAHHYGWTVQTKAHNAILVDGTGQPNNNLSAFGRLLAFEQGDEYMYCAGEARWAYHEVKLDRFTRHVLALKPDLFLVYDQIEAPDAHAHQYLLNAEREMGIEAGRQAVEVVGERARCRVTLVEPADLSISQHHEFDPPALKWRDDRGFEMPDQWHVTAETAGPAASRRFLAVIEVRRAGEQPSARVERLAGDGWLGARIERDGGEVLAGFAQALPTLEGEMPRARMDLGGVSAEAFAAAVEIRDGNCVRAVTIGGTGL